MANSLKQFTIRKLREPTEKDISKDIEWVCNSLGFITPRDYDKTAFRILKALIAASKEGSGMTSEELTQVVKPTIGSVIYHLKKLMRAGLVVKLGPKYELKMRSLQKTVDELNREVNAILSDIKNVAKDIDTAMGLEHR